MAELKDCIKMEFACKIDGEKFETEKALHMHLRKHKMRMAEYYQKYYPRRDLLTGELIKFKNKAHYFTNYFNSRPNMRKYLESAPEEDARKFCVQVIKDRMERRKIKYSPTQVELRSSMMPPIFYYQKLFGNYYNLCWDLGLLKRFNKLPKNKIEENIDYSLKIQLK